MPDHHDITAPVSKFDSLQKLTLNIGFIALIIQKDGSACRGDAVLAGRFGGDGIGVGQAVDEKQMMILSERHHSVHQFPDLSRAGAHMIIHPFCTGNLLHVFF
jgi:hypothetical protein